MQTTDQTPQRLPPSAGTPLRQYASDSSEPVQSTDLLKGQKSVVIEHNGSIYRLQATKLGKLILTK
jgi:hemin uptake protein HemP